MSHSYNKFHCLILVILTFLGLQRINSQEIKGTVLESVTKKPVAYAVIVVPSTGAYTQSDSLGNFILKVSDNNMRITVSYPGYKTRDLYINNQTEIRLSIVPDDINSMDNIVPTPLGNFSAMDMSNMANVVSARRLKNQEATSLDQVLQGEIPGVNVVNHGGMPGEKSWVNIRGLSSIYGSNEPLVVIDGMIHYTNYIDKMLIDGYSYNPLDIVDIADVADISVISDGVSYMGGSGSNGIININTEKESETSTSILINAHTGVSFNTKYLEVMDAPQFRQYFTGQLQEQGYSANQINTDYPWLNGNVGTNDYYKYNNSTDWQKEIFKPALLQKYHIFLKGGDDVATYNVSTGLLRHQGAFSESLFSRYNLRINGRINITKRFSVAPNVKLSQSDSYLPKSGSDFNTNPILASLRKSPLMAPYRKDPLTGNELSQVDDIGVFNVSNPVAIIENGTGNNRNYHFMSSAEVKYVLSKNLFLESLTGIDYNNAREDIFIPNVGLASFDSVKNSPSAMVIEYKSTQNNTAIEYNNTFNDKYTLRLKSGMRIVSNIYHYDKNIDFNTPTDDFTNVGDGGSETGYLKIIEGENRELNWISYYGAFNFDISKKYYLSTNLAYDASSITNLQNRYHLYPSVSLAWRLSSEEFLANSPSIDDLKLKLGWSNTGNIYSNVYDYSKLFYGHSKIGKYGVFLRESIPNEDLDIERKTIINAGIDMSLFDQATNVQLNYYISSINNLVIPQNLPSYYGYTELFDNGGQMKGNGVELLLNNRFMINNSIWMLGGTFNMAHQEITRLNTLFDSDPITIEQAGGAEYIITEGQPINSFYGFQTNGVYTANSTTVGPKGMQLMAGDIIFVEQEIDNVIDDKDKTIIGDPNPDFFGGFFATCDYKSLSFSANFNYSIGNDIYNYVGMVSHSMDSYANQNIEISNRWPAGNEIPRASYGDPTGNNVFSDRWIEDGSYMKLKSISVDYKLKGNRGLYKNMTVYVVATNLLTLTKYTGYDPEMFYMNNPFYMGIDYGKIPQMKSIIVGVKFEL